MNIEYIKLCKFIEDNKELNNYIERLLSTVEYKDIEKNQIILDNLQELGDKYIQAERGLVYIFGQRNSDGTIAIISEADAESIFDLCKYTANITPILRVKKDNGDYTNIYNDFYFTGYVYGTLVFSRNYIDADRVYIEEISIYTDGSIRDYSLKQLTVVD
jgi:hypothetical protein